VTNPNRAGIPYAAPRGHRWVPSAAPSADVVEVVTGGGYRKCAARRSADVRRHNPCNATAVAVIQGQFLCAYHLLLDGMWVDAGIVLTWALEPTGEEG
jgi:hypothetical protein